MRAGRRSSCLHAQIRRGFTLLELMVVVVIMSILASSVIPMMSQSTQAKQAASRDEVVRYFEFARGRAISGGVPVGVVVNSTDNTLRIITLDDDGDIINAIDPIDGEVKSVNISDVFSGAGISSFVNGDGVSGTGTVWFDFQAEPHTRDDVTGDFDALFSQNASLTLSTGTMVVVHASSGYVETR